MHPPIAQIDWTQKIYTYTERGDDPSFWAEPLNAWTNAGFWIAAAVFASWLVSTRRAHSPEQVAGVAGRGDTARLWLLNALLIGIGAGSFCFHTFAERWAALLDVGFIVLWVYWFLWINGTRVLRWPGWATAGGLLLHLGAGAGVLAITASPRLVYVPTLLTAYALALHASRFPLPGARWLWGTAIVFTVSLTMAWLDAPLAEGVPIGTHFLWHLCNAIALLLGSIGLGLNLRTTATVRS